MLTTVHRRAARRLVLVAIAIAALAAAAAAGGSATATAATGDCSGSLIDRKPITAGATTIGELVLYWNAATGRNCARTNHLGPAYGVAAPTLVTMVRCPVDPSRRCDDLDPTDTGSYGYYAGPITIAGRGYCVAAVGSIRWKGVERSAGTGSRAHCG